jgi:hypothetical protein
MYRLCSTWIFFGVAMLGIAALPSSSAAQASAATIAGTWAACFHVDSASRAGAKADAICTVLTFNPIPYCGWPTVAYMLGDYWPYQQDAPTDTTRVQYGVGGDTLTFGGRVTRRPSAPADSVEHCTISGDDGSLFGTGTIASDSITGHWGTMWFGSNGPIGSFVLRRR